jgi:FtsP/CotA-like multicopper oxidase with cupredoxin domain
MKRTTQLGALCLAGGLALATTALAQEDTSAAQSQQTTTTRQTTQVTDDGVARTTTTTTVTGKVVRYEPGKTIVVLGSDNKEMSYTLASGANAPADVQIGKEVSLSTEPGENGAVLVRHHDVP